METFIANLEESIYDFLLTQQNETKKLLHYEIDFAGDFNSYINNIINPITDDRDDLPTHSTSKLLFYHFNNLMRNLNEYTYEIRHTLISDDKYVLEVLQSKNCSYFIKKTLEVSQGNISSLNMSRVSSDNLSEDIKTINNTKDNSTICKDTYSHFCSNTHCVLQGFCKQRKKNILKK